MRNSAIETIQLEEFSNFPGRSFSIAFRCAAMVMRAMQKPIDPWLSCSDRKSLKNTFSAIYLDLNGY